MRFRLLRAAACIAAPGLLAGLLRYPVEASEAARESLALCLETVIPALFPFFVVSALLVDLGLARAAGRVLQPVMSPLFHVGGPGAAALALGLLGGYPAGAGAAAALYRKGLCSRDEAERMLGFCNNSGPAFFLGVLGSVLGSRTGLLLYGVHIAAAFLTGILLRGRRPALSPSAALPTAQTPPAQAFTGAVTGALRSVLSVSAFVLFFGVAVRLLTVSGILPALAAALACLGLPDHLAAPLTAGLLEMTTGITGLRSGLLPGRAAAAAFLMGWSGLSVHCQALALLRDSGLSPRRLIPGKLLHGFLSAGLTGLLFRLAPPAAATMRPFAALPPETGFSRVLGLDWALSLLLFGLFSLFIFIPMKKRWKWR